MNERTRETTNERKSNDETKRTNESKRESNNQRDKTTHTTRECANARVSFGRARARAQSSGRERELCHEFERLHDDPRSKKKFSTEIESRREVWEGAPAAARRADVTATTTTAAVIVTVIAIVIVIVIVA